MSSRSPRPDTFYSEQVPAYHRTYTREPRADARESLQDYLQSASAVVTGAILLLTVLVSYCSPDGTLPGALLAIGGFLWDVLVFVIPAPLVFALDSWLDPSHSSPSPSSLSSSPSPSSPYPSPSSTPSPPHRSMHGSRESSSSSSSSSRSRHAAKSEALSRVMGLDRAGGVMSSIFRARARALSVTGSVLGLKLDHERPPGLGNRDNSCYQNSILQGLASLSSMPDYLSTCMHGTDLSGKEAEKNVAQTLRTLLADLNDASNNGRTLWTPSLLKSMSTWTQQDAQEYYSVILDDIDKGAALAVKEMTSKQLSGFGGVEGLEAGSDAKDESSASQHSDDSGYQSSASSARLPDTKTVRNPLEGLLAQRVSCVQCGHSDGLFMVPFNCLTLSLGLDKHQHDLYERLDSYSKVESIEGVDCPKCTLLKAQKLLGKLVQRLREEGVAEEKLAEPLRRLEAVEQALEEDQFDEATLKTACKIPNRVSTTKTKQMVIARPPQSLVIHVNRSVFDPSTFNMIKNSAPVNFPMVLDLGPWCLGSAEGRAETQKTQKVAAAAAAKTLGSTAEMTNGNDDAIDHEEDSEEQWELDPMVSMVAGDMGPSRLAGPIYELRAAVTHYGRHENGHYICYRKYPPYNGSTPSSASEAEETREASVADDEGIEHDSSDSAEDEVAVGEDDSSTAERSSASDRQADWWRLSDHNVSKVDEELVMSLSPGVFMLFYECVDPSMILQPAVDEKGAAREEGERVAAEDGSVTESATERAASQDGDAGHDDGHDTSQDGSPEAGENGAAPETRDGEKQSHDATETHGDEASSEGTIEGDAPAERRRSDDDEPAAAGDPA